MHFICCNQTCQMQFSSKFNTNKHERIKGHFEESKSATRKIPHDPSKNLYSCPTIGCKTTSKYKQNIFELLKSCSQVNVNRAAAKENKTCGICNKTFAKKSKSNVPTLPVPSTAIVTVLPSNAMSAPPVSPTTIITVPPSAHHLPPFLCHPPLCCLMKFPHQRPLLYLCHRPSRLPCHQSQPLTNLLPVPS